MLQNRIFNVVYVSGNHGVGLAAEANPDCVIPYSGSAVAGCPVTPVGIANDVDSSTPQIHREITIKTVFKRIVIPCEFAGMKKSVAIYDLKGNLLFKGVTKDRQASLRRDLCASNKLHIVKITPIK